MKIKLLLIYLLILPVIIISCDNEDDSKIVVFNEGEFLSNREKWNNLKLQNYSYEYSNSGYSYTGISSHVKVIVSNGNEISVSELKENGIQDPDKYIINDLFEEIEAKYQTDGMLDESNEVYLEKIEIQYDGQFYYPIEIHYIYHIPDGMVGVWNMHQYISNFAIED